VGDDIVYQITSSCLQPREQQHGWVGICEAMEVSPRPATNLNNSGSMMVPNGLKSLNEDIDESVSVFYMVMICDRDRHYSVTKPHFFPPTIRKCNYIEVGN